jgi:cysteinyl-tRNA synthetase
LRETHEARFPAEILQLRDEREHARNARDFQRADELRRELEVRGYQIRDGKTGPVLMPKRSTP